MARFHCMEAVPTCSDGKSIGWIRYQWLEGMTELVFKRGKKKKNVKKKSTWCSCHQNKYYYCTCATSVIFLFLSSFEGARSIYFLASHLQLWSQRTWHSECFRKLQVLQNSFLWSSQIARKINIFCTILS